MCIYKCHHLRDFYGNQTGLKSKHSTIHLQCSVKSIFINVWCFMIHFYCTTFSFSSCIFKNLLKLRAKVFCVCPQFEMVLPNYLSLPDLQKDLAQFSFVAKIYVCIVKTNCSFLLAQMQIVCFQAVILIFFFSLLYRNISASKHFIANILQVGKK